MATTYPATKQAFTNPAGTTRVDTGVDHAGAHSDLNDTVEALQDTLGTTAGTSIAMNFAEGDFALRVNSSNVMQTAVAGTINNSTLGSPTITGGTIANMQLIGTSQITGGTFETASVIGGTVTTAVIGTNTIQGGTMNGVTMQANIHNHATATDGATVTFDLGTADVHSVTLGGNRVLAVTNSTVNRAFMLNLIQDGTGTRTVTWFATINWTDTTAPTLTTTASKIDTFGFYCTAENIYNGYIVGQNLGTV